MRTGIRRLLGTLWCCAASFIAAGFFGTAFAATHDFNNDARSDVLWFNITTGQALVWLMNSTTVLPTSGSPGTAVGWAAVGQRDFNGDGKADILWRNSATGQVVIWFLDGASVIGGGSPGSVPTAWSVEATGDFNGDGKADILWHNKSTGQLVVWLMNGTTVIGGGSPGSVAPMSGWRVAGAGELDRDREVVRISGRDNNRPQVVH